VLEVRGGASPVIFSLGNLLLEPLDVLLGDLHLLLIAAA
jgi:hypothetical protein